MSEDAFVILLIITCFVVFSGYSFDLYDTSDACKDRWGDSEYTVSFNTDSGCIIKINNVWVKENNIKFELPTKKETAK